MELLSGTIALQADNGLFLSRIDRGGGGIDFIEANKSTVDIYSKYYLTKINSNKIALRANNGLYLSRFSLVCGDYIVAVRSSVDIYSVFTVEYIDNNMIALCADNGKYLSRINSGGIFSYIKPDRDDVDIHCQFKVIKL
ncbi:fascin domain-containing protein [Photorhabdus heterorhabditis]|uniref:Fascin domain-containing protein n=1 Tax=Photorhabdus heterorhabditis TaxID=880156 RepID=A0A5B0XAP1_9GAMM|nr:hypothetical protein [Photorhabdus heterorhabditis]KAA1195665.1 hypothetical protein F0L16_00620 [Photorhabdus heterorhabditis]KOY62954.1 hypothetical protein AM629_06195 [Photorhabdus heterorhabditis]MBS9440843.1 hypothetical protein [Photorhabdus heterorhabditis]